MTELTFSDTPRVSRINAVNLETLGVNRRDYKSVLRRFAGSMCLTDGKEVIAMNPFIGGMLLEAAELAALRTQTASWQVVAGSILRLSGVSAEDCLLPFALNIGIPIYAIEAVNLRAVVEAQYCRYTEGLSDLSELPLSVTSDELLKSLPRTEKRDYILDFSGFPVTLCGTRLSADIFGCISADDAAEYSVNEIMGCRTCKAFETLSHCYHLLGIQGATVYLGVYSEAGSTVPNAEQVIRRAFGGFSMQTHFMRTVSFREIIRKVVYRGDTPQRLICNT